MAKRLTTFSKFLITMLIILGLFFLIRYVLNKTEIGSNLKKQGEEYVAQSGNDNGSSSGGVSTGGTTALTGNDVLDVQLVTWGGYAPGLYFNEGALPTTRSRYFKDYGLKVKFHLNDNLENALNGWVAGEYDVLVQTADAFPLYTAPTEINDLKPRAFMQVDWSRGGDVIIAKRGINSINDLKGKRVAVAEPSPSQTLLIAALEAAGLNYSDVQVVASPDPVVAATTFKGPDVDAAVVWSPFHLEALREIPGSKQLISSRELDHIIGDIMFAKQDYIDANRDKIQAFYEGWMKGVAELYANEGNQQKAAKLLGEFLGFPEEDAMGAMMDVRWASQGDNMNFFGLNPSYRGMKGGDLYSKMATSFFNLEQAERVAPPWRSVTYTGAVSAANSRLTGPQYRAEDQPEFAPPSPAERTAPALATKPITINFPTGQSALSENAKTIIDLQLAGIAKSFGYLRVRVEGNTDNVGQQAMNIRLSEARARSVADYLAQTYGMSENRFIIVGNGPSNPVAGCEDNATEACRAKNRRTEFQLLSSAPVQ
ncbi:MAG: OmpA family protein [Saprospiraceae bacterium]|nr:OmpA family protein [Saprospiraceae bacterium]